MTTKNVYKLLTAKGLEITIKRHDWQKHQIEIHVSWPEKITRETRVIEEDFFDDRTLKLELMTAARLLDVFS